MQAQNPSFDVGDLFAAAATAVCPLLFLTIVSYLLGLFVFSPLYPPRGTPKVKTRFRIADILILVVQIQLSGGLVFAAASWGWIDRNPILRIAVALVAWILVAFWWWTGVRMLARAQVQRGGHRIWFLAIAVPAGYLVTVGMLLLPVTVVLGISLLHMMIVRADAAESLPLVLLFLLYGLVIGTLLAVRWYCRKIVDEAHNDVALHEGIAFGPINNSTQRRTHQPMASDREVRIVDEP